MGNVLFFYAALSIAMASVCLVPYFRTIVNGRRGAEISKEAILNSLLSLIFGGIFSGVTLLLLLEAILERW